MKSGKVKLLLAWTLLGSFYLFAAEFAFRVFVGSLNGSPSLANPFRQSSWRWDSLKSFRITHVSVQEKAAGVSQVTRQQSKSDEDIFVFGGSTSAGSICPGTFSSWVDFAANELNTKIINKSHPMTNSDYAVFKLKQAIESGDIPSVVIWANKPNEINPLFFGFDLNPSIPSEFRLVQSGASSPGFDFWAARFAKTLSRKSLLYSYLNAAATEIINKNPTLVNASYQPLRFVPEGYSPKDLGVYSTETTDLIKVGTAMHRAAMQNYLRNLNILNRLSRERGFKVVLLSLPLRLDSGDWQPTSEDFRNIPEHVYEIAMKKYPNFFFIELRNIFSEYSPAGIASIYCDSMHQTDLGHQLTGKSFASAFSRIHGN